MLLCSHYISRKAVDILIFRVDKKLSYVVQLTCVNTGGMLRKLPGMQNSRSKKYCVFTKNL